MKKILCIVIIVSLLGACQSRPALAPQPTLMLTPVLPVANLAPANVSNMGELTTLSNNSLGPVAAAAFSRDGQEFLAAYSKEGILRQWRLNDGQLLTTTQISKAEVAAVAFDEQAKHLAMGAGDVAPLTSGDTSATFNGARLWDIESGSMVFESDPITLPFGLPAYDVALNSDGSWLIEVGPGGIGGWDINKDRPDVAIALGGSISEDPFLSELTAVTTDLPGQWYAYAQYGGAITVDRRDLFPQLNTAIWRTRIRDNGIPLALGFNATRTRLAAVANNSVTVWDLQALLEGTEVFHQSIPTTTLGALTFSPDGALLAIGTDNGWQIWSVADGKLLLENNTPTYAVAFSPDDRLFAWGDTEGIAHIWGVKE